MKSCTFASIIVDSLLMTSQSETKGQSSQLPESHETPRNILYLDPVELFNNNPAGWIVNEVSYQSMAQSFAPQRLDAVKVVRVGSDTTWSFRVQDGLNRTRVFRDIMIGVLPSTSDFSFKTIPCIDITKAVLSDSTVVSKGERRPERTTLSEAEYIRSVVETTVKHGKIAPDRIAAHLIRGWEGIVGKDLADKFSVIAALNLFSDFRADLIKVPSFLREQSQLFSGETDQTRRKLEEGLVTLARVIKQTNIRRGEVTQAAFRLVGTGFAVLGGDEEVRREVYGLLFSPNVEKKLPRGKSEIAKREQVRIQLGQEIITRLKSLPEDRRGQALRAMSLALEDDHLSYQQASEIISSEDPDWSYQQTVNKINYTILIKEYGKRLNSKPPTELERNLLICIGTSPTSRKERQLYFDHQGLEAAIGTIVTAKKIDLEARTYLKYLKENTETLVNKGVEPHEVNKFRQKIENLLESLKMESYPPRASSTIRELQANLQEAKELFAYRQAVFTIKKSLNRLRRGAKLLHRYYHRW